MIDVSWAMASLGGGRFDPSFMVGATLPSYPAWVGGTAIGVFAGELIGDPDRLGLDAMFPAFFLALLAPALLAALVVTETFGRPDGALEIDERAAGVAAAGGALAVRAPILLVIAIAAAVTALARAVV